MNLEKELSQVAPKHNVALTIGVFDGVHEGHKYLINHLKAKASEQSLLSGIVTFRNHPLEILSPDTQLSYLTTLDDRVQLLMNLGVDFVIPLSFTHELAGTSARDFVSLLQHQLKMMLMVIGPDFALGRVREGNISTLSVLGKEMGFSVESLPPIKSNGQVISSTAIRRALVEGDILTAEKLLGRLVLLHGKVVHGAERGRTLGFPTANLAVNSNQAIPAYGVYVTRALINGHSYPSVTNIGNRPTFPGQDATIEVYLLDFAGDIYDTDLRLEILDRLRGEQWFASADELITQINRDVEQARLLLELHSEQVTTH